VRLSIVTPLQAGAISSPVSANVGPLTVQIQDTNGTPAVAPSGGIAVSLSSASSGQYIFSSTWSGSSTKSVVIPGGASQANFYYGDSSIGTPVITATAAGLAYATQVISIGPSISGVSPQQGPESGGTSVTITGTGFVPGATAVFFGTMAVQPSTTSSTLVTVTSPPNVTGVVDVLVETNGVRSTTSAVDRFVYGSVSNYRGVATGQYSLSASNGTTWAVMDSSRLTLTVVPSSASYAVLSASAALFAGTGVNQDLGITVNPSPSDCPQSPVIWKESGGAITFRPNTVSMETLCTLQQGVTYTVQMVWKANTLTTGTIYAGAGPFGGSYSPTTIQASLTPTSSGAAIQAKTSTNQYNTSTTTAWVPIDLANPANLSITRTFSGATTARLSAYADLFPTTTTPNVDFGICVVSGTSLPNPCPAANVVAWSEAGGSSSFRPLASSVQASYNFSAATYTIGLVWKAASAGTVYAGAGNPPNFSPTVLLVNAPQNLSFTSTTTQPTRQYNSPGNGTSWADMDSTNLSLSFTPAQDSLVYLVATADLFASTTAFNTDLGVCIYTLPLPACDSAGSTIAAWSESGIGATYNPASALIEAAVPVFASKTHTVRLQWRSNVSMLSGTTMFSGAGSNPYSQTSLAAWLVPIVTCVSK
jgi:hypothetical protein